MLIDGYLEGRLDEVHIFGNRFVNTMKQEPIHSTIIPIPQQVTTQEVWDDTRRSAPATGTISTSPIPSR